jgi:indole-3-glycerol phosphate synthase/phosphoribosylanthranilate isomerase
MKPLVKICGLTRTADAELAVSLGAQFVGAIRVASSPRRVSLDEARALFSAVGAKAHRVLVFREHRIADVLTESRAAGADWVQLYDAREKDLRCLEEAGLRVLTVYRMEPEATELPAFDGEPMAERPALLDVGPGGTGRSFDWRLLGSEAPRFTFVAGGIRPENVSELLEHHPYGIDVSSGVEREPGVKDERKLRSLFDRIEERR